MLIAIWLIVIAFISFVITKAVKTKQPLWPKILLAVVLLINCVLFTNSVTSQRNLPLTDEVLHTVSQIDWSADNCTAMGFCEMDGEYYYTRDYSDDGVLISFHISAYDASNPPWFSKAKEFGDITYEAVEVRRGILEISRLFDNNYLVSRYYTFVVDGVQIMVTEHNFERNPSILGEYLLEPAAQS